MARFPSLFLSHGSPMNAIEDNRWSRGFKQLAELQEQIAKIKSRSAARRLDRFAADLEELRTTNAAEYQRVAKQMRVILDR